MTKSIVISVTFESINEYDAPEGWDDMTTEQQDDWLENKIDQTANEKPEWLSTIVYDENGNEIREAWS